MLVENKVALFSWLAVYAPPAHNLISITRWAALFHAMRRRLSTLQIHFVDCCWLCSRVVVGFFTV